MKKQNIIFNQLPTLNKAQYHALLKDVHGSKDLIFYIDNIIKQGVNVLLNVVDKPYTGYINIIFKYNNRILNIVIDRFGTTNISQKYKPSKKNGSGCQLANNDMISQGKDSFVELLKMIKNLDLIPSCWVHGIENYHTLKTYYNQLWDNDQPHYYMIKGEY